MNNGWIKLSRDLLEMPGYFGEKFSRGNCLMDLILLAEWKPRSFLMRGKIVQLQRGQLAIPSEELARRWSMADRTARKRLNEFEAAGLIKIQRSKVVNIITIVDYDKEENLPIQNDSEVTESKQYSRSNAEQVAEQSDGQSDGQIAEQSDGQIAEQIAEPLKNNKNNKNYKENKENKENTLFVSEFSNFSLNDFSSFKEEFEKFRKAYPGRKRGLETEFEAFRRKHKKWREVLPLLMPALDSLLAYNEECRRAGKWTPQMPDLATWLSQSRWEQEMPRTDPKPQISDPFERRDEDYSVHLDIFRSAQ